MARPTQRLFHLVFETHNGRALVPIPERSASPRATSNTAVVDGLKVLDPKRPIREADMLRPRTECQLWATGRHALQKAEKIRQQIIRSRWPRNRHPPSSRRHLGFVSRVSGRRSNASPRDVCEAWTTHGCRVE